MKNILITGGLGFIGSNILSELTKENNTRITVVDDLSNARDDYEKIVNSLPDVDFIFSCYSSDKVIKLVDNKKFNCIFHTAAIPRVSYSVENPYLTTDANVSKTVRLLEACRGKVDRFIFSSSSSVYGGADVLPTPSTYPKNPKSPYAWQKSCIEDLIKIFVDLYGMDAVSLRYFNVFGPGQFAGSPYSTAVSAWCHAVKNNLPLRSDGTGEQSRDLCYVDNVVSANLLCMKYEKKFTGECFNVACEDRISNNQILDFFKTNFADITINNAPPRPGDVMHTQADITRISQAVGYKPLVKFWEGLDRTLEWWKINVNK